MSKGTNIWTLKLDLHEAVTEADLEALGEMIREVEWIEPRPFLWNRIGCVVCVKTQGDVDPLTRIATWAMGGTASPGPLGFRIWREHGEPLMRREGWNGHDGN